MKEAILERQSKFSGKANPAEQDRVLLKGPYARQRVYDLHRTLVSARTSEDKMKAGKSLRVAALETENGVEIILALYGKDRNASNK